MLQAVKRMASYLQSISPGYKPPPPDVVNEICESANGDVRFAMLTLQMKPQEGLFTFLFLHFYLVDAIDSFNVIFWT